MSIWRSCDVLWGDVGDICACVGVLMKQCLCIGGVFIDDLITTML